MRHVCNHRFREIDKLLVRPHLSARDEPLSNPFLELSPGHRQPVGRGIGPKDNAPWGVVLDHFPEELSHSLVSFGSEELLYQFAVRFLARHFMKHTISFPQQTAPRSYLGTSIAATTVSDKYWNHSGSHNARIADCCGVRDAHSFRGFVFTVGHSSTPIGEICDLIRTWNYGEWSLFACEDVDPVLTQEFFGNRVHFPGKHDYDNGHLGGRKDFSCFPDTPMPMKGETGGRFTPCVVLGARTCAFWRRFSWRSCRLRPAGRSVALARSPCSSRKETAALTPRFQYPSRLRARRLAVRATSIARRNSLRRPSRNFPQNRRHANMPPRSISFPRLQAGSVQRVSTRRAV